MFTYAVILVSELIGISKIISDDITRSKQRGSARAVACIYASRDTRFLLHKLTFQYERLRNERVYMHPWNDITYWGHGDEVSQEVGSLQVDHRSPWHPVRTSVLLSDVAISARNYHVASGAKNGGFTIILDTSSSGRSGMASVPPSLKIGTLPCRMHNHCSRVAYTNRVSLLHRIRTEVPSSPTARAARSAAVAKIAKGLKTLMKAKEQVMLVGWEGLKSNNRLYAGRSQVCFSPR